MFLRLKKYALFSFLVTCPSVEDFRSINQNASNYIYCLLSHALMNFSLFTVFKSLILQTNHQILTLPAILKNALFENIYL